jgi:mannose-6-phosphate isomerase
MKPNCVKLAANQFDHFYRGGYKIGALRNGPGGPQRPEEWLGSTVTRFGEETQGLTVLPDGRFLRDAINEDPISWLGKNHFDYFGVSSELLVKLLDPDQRLPVHLHPNRAFAKQHLGLPHGKTEAWIILEAPEDAWVGVGFEKTMQMNQVRELVDTENTTALLASLNKLSVKPGDGVLVPAGIPHAIAEGIFLLELQEPTDLSIMLEWEGFKMDGHKDGHLNLGFDLALKAMELNALSESDISKLRTGIDMNSSKMISLLPQGADPYFRAHAISSGVEIEAGFAVLLALSCSGELQSDNSEVISISRGDAVVIPHAIGNWQITGELKAWISRPPEAAKAKLAI